MHSETRVPIGEEPVVIIGAGPAGLTAAYELAAAGKRSLILEADSAVGGISRTVQYKGYRFDIGGHRFFTKVELVEKIWRDVLGKDFIRRSRLSRLLYHQHFYKYPIEPLDALKGLGVVEASLCLASYTKAAVVAKWREGRRPPGSDFESYVQSRFGRRLYKKFFKTYTEKVWGIPCTQIRAEWAAQRIKGMSIKRIAKDLWYGKTRKRSTLIKSLITEFDYPRLGPGMMWERMRDIVEARTARVLMNSNVTRIDWSGDKVHSVSVGERTYKGTHFISTMPIKDFIEALVPQPSAAVMRAKDDLAYRDFLTVALICKGEPAAKDNWIYIHDPEVRVGRVQIFNNWSPDMVPEANRTCFGMEYFCQEGDELWSLPDGDLVRFASDELERVGLAQAEDVLDGTVVRQKKAYPVYDDKYRTALDVIRSFTRQLTNCYLIGRNGMHRYNNQDHSMVTGILAARNILGAQFDLWKVNIDSEYHEEGGSITEEDLRALESTQPLTPHFMGQPYQPEPAS